MLVVAIVNTTLTILICAHVLACFWFWIGRRFKWLRSRHAFKAFELQDRHDMPSVKSTGTWP